MLGNRRRRSGSPNALGLTAVKRRLRSDAARSFWYRRRPMRLGPHSHDDARRVELASIPLPFQRNRRRVFETSFRNAPSDIERITVDLIGAT